MGRNTSNEYFNSYAHKQKRNFMFIYNELNLSTFIEENRITNPIQDIETDNMLFYLRNILCDNNNTELNLDGQNINTENDLKCIVFSKIFRIQNQNMHNNIPIPIYEIHSEEADIIKINDNYCANLTEIGDIANQNTSTRKTDLTITINSQEGDETTIRKGYSRFGSSHIDIELKYIRKGFNPQYLEDIRRDLCKLRYLVDPNVDHHDNHSESKFGLFFLGFAKMSILLRYLNEGLLEKLVNFNQLNNIGLLLFYKENDIL